MKHQRREWVKKNPERDKYNHLKGNAKRRGIPFNLTFEEFKKFCDETGYAKLSGRTSGCLTIDRERRHDGYQYDNLTAITLDANRAKYNAYERHISDFDPEEVARREAEPLTIVDLSLIGINIYPEPDPF